MKKKIEMGSLPHTLQKINDRWIQDYHVKDETLNFRRKTILGPQGRKNFVNKI